jgi:hypothetical protein
LQPNETNQRPAWTLRVAERMRAVPSVRAVVSLVVGSWVLTTPMRGRRTWWASTTLKPPVVKRHEARERRLLGRGQPTFAPERLPDAESK